MSIKWTQVGDCKIKKFTRVKGLGVEGKRTIRIMFLTNVGVYIILM